MLGCTNDTLLIEAATMVLFGHVWFCEHWIIPKPTVKKKRLSTVFGTFAGNFAEFKLRILLLNFVAKDVSLNCGSTGLRSCSFLFLFLAFETEGFSYSSNPVAVVLSKVAGPVA